MRTQVTFDVADPHGQAAFWAEVLGLQVEDHSELVDRLIADGRMAAEDRITIGDRSAFRDSGSTATFTGARRGSRRSNVRLSTPPLVFGASSSV